MDFLRPANRARMDANEVCLMMRKCDPLTEGVKFEHPPQRSTPSEKYKPLSVIIFRLLALLEHLWVQCLFLITSISVRCIEQTFSKVPLLYCVRQSLIKQLPSFRYTLWCTPAVRCCSRMLKTYQWKRHHSKPFKVSIYISSVWDLLICQIARPLQCILIHENCLMCHKSD